MEYFLYVIIMLMALCIVSMARNHLTFKMRMRALEQIRVKGERLIDEGRYQDTLTLYKDCGYEDNYTSQMYDLTKWTFKQFYPKLAEEQSGIPTTDGKNT